MKNAVENIEKLQSSGISSGVPGARIIPVPGRPKTYRVQVTLGRIGGRTRTVTRTVQGLAAARRMARELSEDREAAATAARPKRGSLTLSAAVDRYLRAGRASWAPKTYQTKDERLGRYVVPFLGADREVSAIAPLDVQALQDQLTERLAGTTCKAIMLTTQAFFSQLVSWGVIPESPVKTTPIRAAAARKKEIWTPDQVSEVLADQTCPLWLRLLLVAGCRPEELQGLTWENVDFNRCGITICQVGYYDTGRKCWKVRQGAKTQSSIRFIPLDADTMSALAAARDQSKSEYVVPAPSGGIIPIVTLRQRLGTYARRAGLPVIALYALRHSSITFLLEAGVMVKTVAARAGHSNTSTTLAHYATVTDGAARAAADTFAIHH